MESMAGRSWMESPFTVCKGEILGIAGVSGNGQGELTHVIDRFAETHLWINKNRGKRDLPSISRRNFRCGCGQNP